MRLIACALLALVASCAPPPNEDEAECANNDDCEDRGFCVDGVCHPCDEGLPEPNDPCLPRCGNSLGVGMACTAGGGECTGNDVHALFCTIDQVADADLHMCTGPCVADEDCGEDAVCQGDPEDPNGPKGCVPAACASE